MFIAIIIKILWKWIIKKCLKIEEHKKNFSIKIIKVPGVFEIPVTISKNLKKYDAFIALRLCN